MKTTIMDNAKSDIIMTKMALEYYDNMREKDIKRQACYHLYSCMRKIFIAIIVNDNLCGYDEATTIYINELYNIAKNSDKMADKNIKDIIDTISKWDENKSLLSIDFRPNIEKIKEIYNSITKLFDELYDKNAVK